MHSSAFQYILPTDTQKEQMQVVRNEADRFAKILMDCIPDGPDKTYLLRKHREVAMWANIAITRNPDGSPRN